MTSLVAAFPSRVRSLSSRPMRTQPTASLSLNTTHPKVSRVGNASA